MASDEWTLTDVGFQEPNDADVFALNVAAFFTGGEVGDFLVYSTDHGLTEGVLANTMISAGHTWTIDSSIIFDVPTLLAYNAVFVAGEIDTDNYVLIDYVNAGGNVYLAGGAVVGGAPEQAAAWSIFLNAFGLNYEPVYDNLGPINVPIGSTHPIFEGVHSLYQYTGNPITDLEPDNGANAVLVQYGGFGLYAVYDVGQPCAQSDARCIDGRSGSLRSAPFPPCGLDDFATGASFKVVMLDGSEAGVGVWVDGGGVPHGSPAVDAHTIIGRSDPFFEGDPEDDGALICGGGQPPYANTALRWGDPCVFPAGFPEDSTGGHEIHTEILSLNLVDPDGNTVKAGQPFYDSVVGTPQERFYRNSFGEVQGLDNDFPGDSFFNVFVEVTVGPLKFYNKTPTVLRAEITQFPPDLSLPRSVYLHDPSFPPTPLFDANGIHVAFLLSAGHGSVGVTPPPAACDPLTRLASPVSFTLDNLGTGAVPGSLPNHAMDDQGLPVQPLTVYRSSGATLGAAPDLTNARTPGPVGSVGGLVPPEFTSGDAINSLSFGRDGSRGPDGSHTLGALLFSVDRETAGSACSAVGLFGTQQTNPEQAADIYVGNAFSFGAYSGPFLPTCPQSEGNCLLADQTILGLRPLVAQTGQDNLTGLEASARAVGDRFYGTFVAAGLDPATIYVYDDLSDPAGHPFEPANLVVFATGAELGLQAGDVIDALALSDITSSTGLAAPNGTLDVGVDEVLFSLARGSPTLFGTDGAPGLVGVDDDGNSVIDDVTETGLGDDLSAADILYSNFNGTHSIFVSHDRLGLLPTDNVDALDIGPTVSIVDCNCNGLDDACDVARAFSKDCNTNGTPDECERFGNDCNCNDVPDECDIAGGTSADCNANGIPDECDTDTDGDGVPDDCDQCPFDPTNTKVDGQCIPTLSEWGMVAMAALMLSAGGVVIARRRVA